MKRLRKPIFYFLISLLVMAAGCGSAENTPTEPATGSTSETTQAVPAEADADMKALNEAMCGKEPDLPEMSYISSSEEDAKDLFSYFSSIDYEKISSYFLSYSSSGGPYEIGVIALKDEADAAECKKTLEAHVEDRAGLFRSYAPEQVAQAENTLITVKGRYVAMIMSSHNSAVEKAFLDFISAHAD